MNEWANLLFFKDKISNKGRDRGKRSLCAFRRVAVRLWESVYFPSTACLKPLASEPRCHRVNIQNMSHREEAAPPASKFPAPTQRSIIPSGPPPPRDVRWPAEPIAICAKSAQLSHRMETAALRGGRALIRPESRAGPGWTIFSLARARLIALPGPPNHFQGSPSLAGL